MTNESFIAGISSPTLTNNDAAEFLKLARSDKFDFVVTCLPHSNDITRQDVINMASSWWATSVVGVVADPPHLFQQSDNTNKYLLGTRLLEQLVGPASRQTELDISYMLDWACHMSIPAVILPTIPEASEHALQYARIVSSLASKTSARNVQLWIRTPCTPQALASFSTLHKRCDSASNIGVMLSIERNDSLSIHQQLTLIHLFIGCNLRAVSLNTSTFIINKKGFPVLGKVHQILFAELLKRLGRTIRVLVDDSAHVPTTPENCNFELQGKTGCLAHLQYLQHLRKKDDVVATLDSNESRMETNYLDHLQSALQPLGDDLEFSTYETFERDPAKYVNYQKAIEFALLDGLLSNWFRRAVDTDTVHVTIIVVGAGRGPLIQASLDAVDHVNSSSTDNIQVQILGIEKNPCAVSYLRSLLSNRTTWQTNVSIVQCDIRYAKEDPMLNRMIHGSESHKADLVVSELLGSFGDNELSPECLDGIERSGLIKETCVSIPQSYTSYIAPVSSMRLHSEAQSQAFFPFDPSAGPCGKPCGILQAMETPYVVRPHAASQVREEQPCWSFHHFHLLDNNSTTDNERFSVITFPPDESHGRQCGSGYGCITELSLGLLSLESTGYKNDIYIHGFLGTFSCVLYQSIHNKQSISTICTAPKLFTRSMFSWFPLYFPLRESMLLPHKSSVAFNIWRRTEIDSCVGRGRVWYEWCANITEKDGTLISSSVLHNPNGRSSFVRL